MSWISHKFIFLLNILFSIDFIITDLIAYVIVMCYTCNVFYVNVNNVDVTRRRQQPWLVTGQIKTENKEILQG